MKKNEGGDFQINERDEYKKINWHFTDSVHPK